MLTTCIWSANSPNWFPAKQTGATLAYTLDISNAIALSDDPVSASVAVAPSGSGELELDAFTVSGTGALTITETGGQPGRIYTIEFIVTMANGNVYEFIVLQGVPLVLTGYPTPPAPAPGFGTPVTWGYSPSFDFSLAANSWMIPLV